VRKNVFILSISLKIVVKNKTVAFFMQISSAGMTVSLLFVAVAFYLKVHLLIYISGIFLTQTG